ncbi:MAG TPA: TIGR03546 family protein [Gemmatimonadaceae bacterium]|nr:TIGR03546 family protein [Gemmatimonadaceae bacterium]
MLAILKLLQSLVRELHSDGTPAQIAFGAALGAALGLTPIANVHNVVIVALLLVLNVSFGAGMLAWALFVPLGFALDPLFDRVGRALLLETPALTPLWTTWFNAPLVPYTNFNNTVVLGSVVIWLVLFAPIFALSHVAVVQYRRRYVERVRRSRLYQAVTASKIYNVYTWFRPE